MDNRFGTTSGMVIQTVMENGQELCLAIDERGLYLTSARYLDKNLADPHRYSGSRATTKARLLALDLSGRGQCPPHPGLYRRDQEKDQPPQGVQTRSEGLVMAALPAMPASGEHAPRS